MIANSAFLAAMIVLVLVISVMGDLQYLARYKHVIVPRYLGVVASAVGVVFVNLFAGIYLVARGLFLKDTGRKLAHVEKQLRTGDSVARDLSARLDEED
jgi:hypothetical protein